LEDLWAFNEEVVAAAILRAPMPVISAVGHETDFTISDHVADERAPTPTAGAARAVPDQHAERKRLSDCLDRLADALRRRCESARSRLEQLEGRPCLKDRLAALAAATRNTCRSP
ncbi:MAG TPA: exodeoxyribonuclease VII large subunit, partial [Gemmatales bacterium]|nr:exodeoxyribonuclease VII large subunit [Gemmatales bacterium]